MKGRWFALTAAALAAVAVISFEKPEPVLADDKAAKAGLAADEFKMVADSDIEFLRETLDQPDVILKRKRSTMFSVAMMIAYNAQEQIKAGQGDPKQLAAVRDAALAVGEKVVGKDFAEAKKLAAELKTDMAANGADPKPVEIKGTHGFELYDLMSPFRLERAGGRNLEADLRDFKSVFKLRTPQQVQDAQLAALRAIPISEMAIQFAPEQDEGDKKVADWVKWSEQTTEIARQAADALKKGDKKTATVAFRDLDKACTDCHNVFRD